MIFIVVKIKHYMKRTWFLPLRYYFWREKLNSWPVCPNSSDERSKDSVLRDRKKYKWQCYHFTFVNQNIFMSVCCVKFATSRILLEWIQFLYLIIKMQKDLNSKCTEKRSQVKSDPIFPHDPNVNKNIIFTMPHSEYKVTLSGKGSWAAVTKAETFTTSVWEVVKWFPK